MNKYGVAFRPKGRKKIKVSFHDTEYSRNAEAKVLSDSGYKIRKLKPKMRAV